MTEATTVAPPEADWVDVPTMLTDPYETYRRLRELGPVVRIPTLGRYLVTGFDACRAVENDQARCTTPCPGYGPIPAGRPRGSAGASAA